MSPSPLASPRALAEHIRASREHVVAEIRAGRLVLDGAAEGDDIDQVKVVVLAESVPGVGKVRARSVLDSLGIEHATRWGELGCSRNALVAALTAVRGGDA